MAYISTLVAHLIRHPAVSVPVVDMISKPSHLLLLIPMTMSGLQRLVLGGQNLIRFHLHEFVVNINVLDVCRCLSGLYSACSIWVKVEGHRSSSAHLIEVTDR